MAAAVAVPAAAAPMTVAAAPINVVAAPLVAAVDPSVVVDANTTAGNGTGNASNASGLDTLVQFASHVQLVGVLVPISVAVLLVCALAVCCGTGIFSAGRPQRRASQDIGTLQGNRSYKRSLLASRSGVRSESEGNGTGTDRDRDPSAVGGAATPPAAEAGEAAASRSSYRERRSKTPPRRDSLTPPEGAHQPTRIRGGDDGEAPVEPVRSYASQRPRLLDASAVAPPASPSAMNGNVGSAGGGGQSSGGQSAAPQAPPPATSYRARREGQRVTTTASDGAGDLNF